MRAWVLPCLLIAALFGCTTSEDRIVAKAKRLAVAGRPSDATRLLQDYLERTPQSTEPRRLKILLAIEDQRSEEALPDYEAISASQKKEDPVLLHELALGLIRDALQSNEGFLRARAATALAELADSSSDWLILRGLQNPDPSVRAYAVETVGRLGKHTLQAELVRLLDDPDPFVRAASAWAIGRLGQASN